MMYTAAFRLTPIGKEVQRFLVVSSTDDGTSDANNISWFRRKIGRPPC